MMHNFGGRGGIGPRPRSPRRERREERVRTTRDSERERNEKDKEEKRESRKRSRSRGRSRSPPRRRMRVVPRYNVQVPKILLHMKEANVLELKKRYSNLYVPSDVFLARPLWSDTFPAYRAFQFPRPVSFHIMNKEVEPVLENDAVYDPPDVNHCYAAKVMLMAVPAVEDVFRRSCALSEDHADVRECFVHPTRLINFLVGLKGKNETMAIGGYWSPSLDGANPEKDPNVLIHTAIRTCKALTGIDLAGCTTW
ncbi:Cell division cycle and apoptosis regulator protein 1 [Halocaridina rubra]|uniref:Cell division cycle and apoptosis regulator protein 1 n=1 Tax=Halocaridina rubra TaxID=373956 RepID=A0AAN9ACY1_HALRR